MDDLGRPNATCYRYDISVYVNSVLLLRRLPGLFFYNAFHCNASKCTIVPHYIVLHCTALDCTAPYCTAPYCTAQQCTALHCTTPQTTLCCRVRHYCAAAPGSLLSAETHRTKAIQVHKQATRATHHEVSYCSVSWLPYTIIDKVAITTTVHAAILMLVLPTA